MRILYECLDIAFPAGGVRRLYRHVELLRAHGFEAAVLHHTPGFRVQWFDTTAPVLYWTPDFVFRPDDILVIPEGHVDVMKRTIGAPFERAVIALNWGRIYQVLGVGEDWRDFGISRVIAGSQYERTFIAGSMGLDATVLASGIDHELFKPVEEPKCQIAYMPRKNAAMYRLIAGVFRSRFRHLADVPFVSINNVSHKESARILAESAVFLTQSFPEGLSRKGLEAMACGSIVVGFAGGGSLEYMHHLRNCYLAPDADVLTCAEYLGAAVEQVKAGTHGGLRHQAIETAHSYSLARAEATVVAYWKSVLAEKRAGAPMVGESS
jgi:glycosyltransferase involved in cell wall biosynthesis